MNGFVRKGQVFSIGTERQVRNDRAKTGVLSEQLSGSDLPDPYCKIISTCDQPFTVRAERQDLDRLCVSFQFGGGTI